MTTSQRQHVAAQRRFDAAERRIVRDIDLLYREAFDVFGVEIDILGGRVDVARAAGEQIDEVWLAREPVYRRLLDRVSGALLGFRDRALAIVVTGLLRFGVLARADAMAQLVALGIPAVAEPIVTRADVGLRVVPPTATGITQRDVLEPLERIRTQIITNLERNISEVVTTDGKRLSVSTVRDRVYDTATEARLRTIVRTTTMQAYREETRRRHMAVADVLQGVQWVATLSSRTCLACLSRHGTVYPVGYRMESHPNCRCRLAPLARGTSADVPETGEAWFARQPEAVQRARLGQAFGAYAGGRLTLDDFTGIRQSERWGRAVYQRSATDALRRAR